MVNLTRPDRLPEAGFWATLEPILQDRGIAKKKLARMIGISDSQIHSWAKGRSWPNLNDVEAVAEALEDESLIRAAVSERTRRCKRCRRQFVAIRKNHVFCNERCQIQDSHDREKERGSRKLGFELTYLRDTIAQMCNSCEPLGLCRDAGCPIQVRGRSPLPLAKPRGQVKPVFTRSSGPIPVKA